MEKTLNAIAWLTIILAFGLILLGGFWLICPYKPIEFNQPLRVNQKKIRAGDHLEFTVDYCKKGELQAVVTNIFVNSIVYYTPSQSSNLESGCRQLTYAIYIPKALPPGDYHIKSIYTYRVNPLKTVDVVVNTETFTIIKDNN